MWLDIEKKESRRFGWDCLCNHISQVGLNQINHHQSGQTQDAEEDEHQSPVGVGAVQVTAAGDASNVVIINGKRRRRIAAGSGRSTDGDTTGNAIVR